MILNLRPLNEFVDYHHFKMDTFQTALKLIQPGCFMASVDLKDAYYSIPVHPEHRKYLMFEWEGQYYQFTCLPNGLSSAPRVFTKILKRVYSHLRSIGQICMGHIDDSLLVAFSLGSCRKNIYDTVNLFTLLGFTIHPVKSVLEPTQTIQFLGLVIDSVAMTVKFPPSKAAKVKSGCQNLVLNCNPTIREVAQVIIGLIVSSFPAIQYAQLHYRTLESEKIYALKVNAGNYEFTMTLSQMAKREFTWWIENIDMASRPIMFGNPDITITTDASNLGWGAVCNRTKTGGPWVKDEADFHINYLEMKAVLLGLKSLCNNTTGKHIRVQSDNTTTVSYINEMGGIKSVLCNDMAQTIWAWCIDSNIWLSACHIPGSQNTDAAKQSREFNVSTEWSLCTQVFEHIQKLWGKFDADLFASRLISWRPDPNAMFVNALYMNWHNYSFYAFAPFSLIGTCLQKIQQDRATGVIIVPLWPTQPRFTVLLYLPTDNPRILPCSKTLLTQSHNGALHPLRNQLRLIACKLSGERSNREAFQAKLPISSSNLGLLEPRNNINRISRSGLNFVMEGRTIHMIKPIATVLDFLVSLHEKGLGYSTLNTARSAISAIVLPHNDVTIGSNPIISRFMKGIFKINPPTPRYKTTWDPHIVSNNVSSLGTGDKLTLKLLSMRRLMLTALVSAKRGQSLHMLDIRFMKEGETV